jgi:inorganic triphosphatase YgiF
METELKFALSPEARKSVERHTGVHAVPHADHTIYFDTPDLALRKAGFTLRIRHRLGEESFVQNVKAPVPGGSPFQRQEWEWPVAGEQLELDRLSEVPALPLLLAGDKERLKAVFRTEVERTKCVLSPSDGARVELAIDEGVVAANGHSEPLSDLEIELKEGPEEALYRLGLDLLRAAPLSLLMESKADRGYRLYDGSRPAARKAQPITLNPGLGLHAAFVALTDAALDQLLANQPAALKGCEVEGIHQMRVAVRRLRSLLRLFEPCIEPHARARFEDELRRLGEVLGAARDWDVFVAETLPAATDDGVGRDWIEPLRARTVEKQHAAHQAAKKVVLASDFSRFVLAFQAWSRCGEALMPDHLIDRQLAKVAPGLLDRLAKKVGKRLVARDADDAASLHALRKDAKKLRYSIEFLDALYARDSKGYLKSCDALQKRLGDFNDLETTTRLATELSQDGHLDLAPALGVVANWTKARRPKLLKRAEKACEAFAREKPFWQ